MKPCTVRSNDLHIEHIITKLQQGYRLSYEEYVQLIQNRDCIDRKTLYAQAQKQAQQNYGKNIYLRGLIEISNFCKNDCYYCGIRCSNIKAVRYRLTTEDILTCCQKGYALGMRTFVLQGGEDSYFTDEHICNLILTIRQRWPGAAITLSLGEKSLSSYQRYYEAGAVRYLLRHETADALHYQKLHPPAMSLKNRRRCLTDLQDIGYQVGAGFMVGSPAQTVECLAKDLLFLQEFKPHMAGIGPFIPHDDTPFASARAGTAEDTLFFLALVRLILPQALLPATTALGTVAEDGWQRGVLAGANVIMLNLTPSKEKEHYSLYNGKNPTSAAEAHLITEQMDAIGYRTVVDRGDHCAIAQKFTEGKGHS